MIYILNNVLFYNDVQFVYTDLKYTICDKNEVRRLLYNFKYKKQIINTTSFFVMDNPVFSNVYKI